MLNRSGASTHPWRRSYSTANHPEHTLSSSRTHARMPSWNWRMTEVVFCGTPKRTSTDQRRVRSTESYLLVRSIKACIHKAEFVSSEPAPVTYKSQTSYWCLKGSLGNHSVAPAGSPSARSTRWSGERGFSVVSCRRALPPRCPCSCRTLPEPSFYGVPWWWHISIAAAPRSPSKYKQRYQAVSAAGRDHRWGWSWTVQRGLHPVRQRINQPGDKVVNPARGQLNGVN